MDNKKSEQHEPFTLDTEGYLKAKKWLIENGEWERVSTSGFSTDGYSIIETANYLYKNKKNNG